MLPIERNREILEKQFIKTIDQKISQGKKIIEKELSSGLFDLLARPVVQAFYDYWSKDSRKECVEQIKIILNCGMSLFNKEDIEIEIEKTIEKNFHDYLRGDQFAKMCNKNHQNFIILEAKLKEIFIIQIKESMILLDVKENVDDYNGLVKTAFISKDEARDILVKQLESYENCLEIIGRDLSILIFPAGKRRIFKVLMRNSEKSKKEFLKELDLTYDI